MTRTLRRALVPVVALSMLAGLAGCGSTDENGIDDDKLVVYSGRQEHLVGELFEQFEKETGIEVSVRYGNTAQLAAQLIEEGERPKADVYFSQDAGALGALAKRDRLIQLPHSVLDKVPAAYRSDEGTWVGTSGRARVIVYDPSQVAAADVPDSVFDLTDPKWKGKIGIAPSNASFEAFVSAMRVMKGEAATREWLNGISANQVKTFDNNVAILNAAEDHLIAVGLINHYYWYEQVAEEGLAAVPARLKFLTNGDPGGLVNVAGVGVLAGTDRREQAQQLVEFLLSEPAQRFFSLHTKEYPLLAGVPLEKDLPPLDRLHPPKIDLSDLDELEKTLTMIEQAGLT